MRPPVSNLLCGRRASAALALLLCLGVQSPAQTNYLRLKSFGFYESFSAGIFGGAIEASDGLLYGTSLYGGTNGVGTVFRMDREGGQYTLLRSFLNTNDEGRAPQAALLEGTDGVLYGMTALGGGFRVGTIFKLSKDGSGYAILHSFSTNATDGCYPYNALSEGSDGLLYGTTYYGGTSNGGTVFRLNKDGSSYQVLKHLGSTGEGGNPACEVMELSDGLLYGTTVAGGTNGFGTIFRLQRDGNGFTTLMHFAGTNGAYPFPGLVEGAGGVLYGTTREGGTSNWGTVFRMNKDGSGHTVLKNFLGNEADDGADPEYGRLCLDRDGFLYGTTVSGGLNGNGMIFKVDTNGNNYSKLRIFRTTVGEAGTPTAGLIEGTDGLLYGTSFGGGRYGDGTVFELDKDGGNYQILMDFPQGGGDGERPQSALVEGSDRKLYGTTYWGGTSNLGAVFRLALDGSGYEVLRSLGGNATDGANPEGALIEGSDGALYGTTCVGGSNNVGTVFRLGKDGSGYTVMRQFSSTGGSGQNPRGKLLEASDGLLYGTTYAGGAYGAGTVFTMAKDGSGFLTLRSFFSVATENVDARNPVAGLVEGSDGALYGTSYNGGTNNRGAVFRITRNGAVCTLLHSFTNGASEGCSPYAGVCEASDGMLYGATLLGGSFNGGTLYKVSKDGNTYSWIYNFSNTQLHTPYGTLIEGPDGMLYGSAQGYGSSGITQGGVFKISKSGSGFTVLHLFSRQVLSYGADGVQPYSGVILGSDGAFYGTTQRGGDLLNAGIVFKLFTARQPIMAISPPDGGSYRVSLTGVAHPRYRIDTSTDLTQWLPLTNLSNPTGTVEIREDSAAAGRVRFYRGVLTL